MTSNPAIVTPQENARMPFPTVTRIDSPRLTLRAVESGDLADLLEVNGDPQVTRFLPYATWESLQDGEAWLARMAALEASGAGRQLVVARQRWVSKGSAHDTNLYGCLAEDWTADRR